MTTVLLVGTGEVAVRAARQLLDTPGLDRLLVTSRGEERTREVTEAFGRLADPVPWPRPGFDALPAGVDSVAIAVPPTAAVEWARRAVRAGVPAVAVVDADDDVGPLLALDGTAVANGVTLAVGCGLAPGLADVLAHHAADALDRADEVHVARSGAAGPACVEALRTLRAVRPLEWRDGAWNTSKRLGPLLVWFPDPIGSRQCEVVAGGGPLLLQAVPEASRITVRVDEPPVRSQARALLTRKKVDAGWSAARVEVWGWQRR